MGDNGGTAPHKLTSGNSGLLCVLNEINWFVCNGCRYKMASAKNDICPIYKLRSLIITSVSASIGTDCGKVWLWKVRTVLGKLSASIATDCGKVWLWKLRTVLGKRFGKILHGLQGQYKFMEQLSGNYLHSSVPYSVKTYPTNQ